MQFKNVVIQSLAAVDAPVEMTSAEIGDKLQVATDRLGMRRGLIEEISGIITRRFWNNGTQPSDAATMAAEEAIAEAGIPVPAANLACLPRFPRWHALSAPRVLQPGGSH